MLKPWVLLTLFEHVARKLVQWCWRQNLRYLMIYIAENFLLKNLDYMSVLIVHASSVILESLSLRENVAIYKTEAVFLRHCEYWTWSW